MSEYMCVECGQKIIPCGGVRVLLFIGKGSLIIVTCRLGLVQWTSAVLWKRSLEAFRPSFCLWTVASWSRLSFDPLCLAIVLLGLSPFMTLPLSSFLVDILRHFRINISQLSVIGAAKISHFEILCRVYEILPTVLPIQFA
uniref:Putative transposase (Putative), gypsy type n=1 Tax=Tanacetum cinerariifolium TaxID=118510 RepID=A0A699IHM9_TANCI|nr:putative transposase (putative), gypsy type [Tanacetum cinerariifolium]